MTSEASRPPSEISGDEFERFIRSLMSDERGSLLAVEELRGGYARLRMTYHDSLLRPGGTIAGPVMFTLADASLYAMTLSLIGLVPSAVTADLTIRFLRRPRPVDLVAEARVLKQGRRLVVGEVTICSAGDPAPVAHVTGAYAVPPAAT